MSELTLQDVYADLLETVRVSQRGDTTLQEVFLEKVAGYLEQDAEIDEPVWGAYHQDDMEIAGYAFDEERSVLTIIGGEFCNDDTISSIVKKEYEQKFKRLKTFLAAAADGAEPLYPEMEVTDPASEVARGIFKCYPNTTRVVFLWLTNKQISRALQKADAKIPSETVGGKIFDFQIFDIERIRQIRLSEADFTDTEIDLAEIMGNDLGLKCLEATSGAMDYRSYLVVLPANVLAKIYDQYGQKLLEQNVRTFLQFKGKVNKGMPLTITEAPERFFAYNNGLTCTAEEPTFKNGNDGLYLAIVKGLQIVNGGQTTSVIYDAYKKGKDLAEVSVQMKLSVVTDKEKYLDFVGKVARYANTQNPVKESDFFSNHPFHKRFKDLSTTILTPAIGGTQMRSRWYYERTRGQYLNEQIRQTASEKSAFLRLHPKSQMFDKIILAKTEAIFGGAPYCAYNAQKAFKFFVDKIGEIWEKNENSINESYFKEIVAKIILTNHADAVVAGTDWYQENRSVKSEFKAFALALLEHRARAANRYLHYATVWDNQNVSAEFDEAIKICVKEVHEYMLAHYPQQADWRETFKRPKLWTYEIRNIAFGMPSGLLRSISIDEARKNGEERSAKKSVKTIGEIDDQTFAFDIPLATWQKVFDFYAKNLSSLDITPVEAGVLKSMRNGTIPVPTPKQAKILRKLYNVAQNADAV
ncbi:hypothetical protein FACS1894139_13960 [Planctomycetales bacterium]|nr:hypothetical protein FACS1894108_14170 [Planctomycetales bacterium]GHT06931.1 hypothetical protein FACS1894139_13960 [Planctomycetales bacterium]